ncbi:MAG: alginate lyase family protein [Geminicoccaceae bacterium]|nr:alginate lyase family protein [Geminicoccaceae bacterium]
MRRVFPVLICVTLVWCPTAGRAVIPHVLHKAGEILVSIEQRRDELRRLGVKQRSAYCGAGPVEWTPEPVVQTVGSERQPGQDLAMSLMRASALVLAFDDEAARRAIVDHLDLWARNDALLERETEHRARVFYNLDRTLMPMIVAFSMVRGAGDVDPEQSANIEAWLGELVDMRRGPNRFSRPARTSSRNNHRYLADSVTMAWGALTGDRAMFDKGIERFHIALGQARDDGSLPLETARGKLALHYQRHAVGSLINIAEMARLQGVDLYSAKSERGLTIHDLVTFLANAIDTPGLLDGYAPREQDLGFLERRGHGRHYMAWFEAYAARFGDRSSARRLGQILIEHGHDGAPMIDDYFGSVTTCLFRPLTDIAPPPPT